MTKKGAGGQLLRVLRLLGVVDLITEQLDGIEEAAWLDNHDDVDRVKVFLTPKAAGEIGLRIGGGVKARAAWTEEAKYTLAGFAEDVELSGDEFGDRDFVPDPTKHRIRVSASHRVGPFSSHGR